MREHFIHLFTVAALLAGTAVFLPAQNPSKSTKPDNTRANQADRSGSNATADQQKNNKSDRETKPDNTRANQADRSGSNPTADQQKNNKSDRETTRQIRKALTSDKSLSTYAHNVKVISQNGTVTLKGPVRSEEEKKTVEAKAAEVVGDKNVKNELTVASEHDKK